MSNFAPRCYIPSRTQENLLEGLNPRAGGLSTIGQIYLEPPEDSRNRCDVARHLQVEKPCAQLILAFDPFRDAICSRGTIPPIQVTLQRLI